MGRSAYILVGAAFIVALGIAGRIDFNSELADAVHYCDMVTAGIWPDYAGRFNDCPSVYAKAEVYLIGDF